MTHLITLLFAGIGVLGAPQASAQPDPEAAAREALARPVSIGSVPFLIQHARYSNVAARLAGALRHERADIRAVAARSIYVLAGSRYAAPVADALAVERDPIAGAEMVRALLAIRGAAADPEAIAAARRLGPAALNAITASLAHTRPLDVLPWLEVLNADADGLPDALLRAIAVDPDRVGAALRALPAGAEIDSVARTFARAGETGTTIPAAVLDPSLARDGALRDAAVVYLLEHEDQTTTSALQELLSASAGASPSGWTSVLLELFARRDPAAERRDLLPIIPTLPRRTPEGLWQSPAVLRLSVDEARVLRAHVFEPSVGDAPAGRGGTPLRTRDVRWTQRSAWRTAEPFVAGLEAAVAQTSGCRSGADEIALVQIGYGAGGQVRQVRVDGTKASPNCRQAAVVLAMLEIAPVGAVAPPDRLDQLVAVFTRDALDCERRSARAQRPRSVDAGSGIREPQKVRDVRPVYPPHLIAARVQGVVLVDAVVDRTGCVNRAVVIREAHADLNVAALAAIAQWRYTPTLLNGEPVPVIMSVTSNFSLK